MLSRILFKLKLRPLRKRLLKKDLVSRSVFKSVYKKTRRDPQTLPENLLAQIREDDHDRVLSLLSEYYDLPVVWLRSKVIALPVLTFIAKDIARELQAIVFKKVQNMVYVATTRPQNPQIKAVVEKASGCQVRLFLTTPKDIELSLSKYDTTANDIDPAYDFGMEDFPADKAAAEKLAKDVPVVKLVNELIERGLSAGASDIHIEPARQAIMVRYRVDGLLRKINDLPKVLLPAVVARIKILANVKIDEHMVPQDGRFRFKYRDREIAVRVSIIPTLNGPKSVLRLLDASNQSLGLSRLGLNSLHLDLVKKEIASPQGLVLVTGPTGSGKTTTLYTILGILNQEDVNICTIEDPIEYDLPDINQMQVNHRVGLSFAQGLRSLMRQDPNIIMVGEIRDQETAEIVMNSAMTGHLVLSTLHTNSAFLAPQRLIEMGVEPYLAASVSNLIMGQRLVRRLCPDCRSRQRQVERIFAEYKDSLQAEKGLVKLRRLGLVGADRSYSDFQVYRPKGCRKCNFSGYRGRIGIYEAMPFGSELRQLVLQRGSENSVRSLMEDQVITMNEDGIFKVINGITTFEEIKRVTRE